MIFSYHTSSKQQARVESAERQACLAQRYLLLGQQQVLVSIGPEEAGIAVTFHQLVDVLLGKKGHTQKKKCQPKLQETQYNCHFGEETNQVGLYKPRKLAKCLTSLIYTNLGVHQLMNRYGKCHLSVCQSVCLSL